MDRKFILTCGSTVDLPYDYCQQRKIPVIFYTYVLDGVEREDDIAVLCGRVLSAKVSGDASPICRAAAAEGLGAGAAHIVICSPVFPDGTRKLPSGGRITVISCGQAEGEEVVSADAEGRIINGYIEI